MAYHSVISIATATRGPPRASQKTNALFLEPVLRDGLRPAPPGGTFKKTFAASGSFSPAVIRALREIFSVPRFEEILTDIFGVTLTGSPSKSGQTGSTRSEERRVGKECRSRWSPYH